MAIDKRILLINDDRREKLGRMNRLFERINGMYDEITDAYDEMRDVYDTLIKNENEMVALERENYESAQREHLERVIIEAAKNGCITLDDIMRAVRNNIPEIAAELTGRHTVAMTVKSLVTRGEILSTPISNVVYGVPDRG